MIINVKAARVKKPLIVVNIKPCQKVSKWQN